MAAEAAGIRENMALVSNALQGGRAAGQQYMVQFSQGLRDSANLAQSAFAQTTKELTTSALRDIFAETLSSAATSPLTVSRSGNRTSPGSSLTNHYDIHGNTFKVQDPADMVQKLAMHARRKNLVQT